MLVAVGDLLRGEYHVDEVFAERAGEGLFQKPQVHLLLLLAHQAHGGVDPRDDLTVRVNITSVDAAEIILIWPEAPAQLVEFFLVHGLSFPI